MMRTGGRNKPGRKRRDEVERLIKGLRALGVVLPDGIGKQRTFGDLCDWYVAGWDGNPETLATYVSLLRIARDMWAGRDVMSLGPQDVDDYRRARRGKASPGTVSQELAAVNRVLRKAAQYREIPGNPLQYVTIKRIAKTRETVWTEAQLKLYADWAREMRLEPLHTFIRWMGDNGIRPIELLRLRWSDIDTSRPDDIVARIRADKSKNKKERYIPVSRRTYQASLDLTHGEGWIIRRPGDEDVPPLNGRRRDIGAVQEHVQVQWRTLRDAKGIVGADGEPAHLYSIRHSVATALINRGETFGNVAGILGNSPRILEQNYWKSTRNSTAETRRRYMQAREGKEES